MKQMHCPLNGVRNISEFIYGGEVEFMPDLDKTNSKEWGKYIYYHKNQAGVVKEWWCHSASSYWFIAERNTISDEIIKTYPPDELFSERVDFA